MPGSETVILTLCGLNSRLLDFYIVLCLEILYHQLLLYLLSDPFYWAWLPMAEEVFSKEMRDLVAPKLQSPGFISGLVDELFELFSVS